MSDGEYSTRNARPPRPSHRSAVSIRPTASQQQQQPRGSSYSFVQTTVYHGSGGAHGYNYKTTTTTTRASNGVEETHRSEHDSRTGVQRLAVHRALNDRSRTLMRERDGSGRERQHEHLQGVREGTIIVDLINLCSSLYYVLLVLSLLFVLLCFGYNG